MPERFDTNVTTTCGYCGVGCRLEAHASDGRVRSITPALDGPANKGHTCLKGRFAHQFSRSRERLSTPLIRDGDGFRAASWDEAIGRIAQELGRIKDAHGPDAIAGLASSRATNEDCWAMQRMMRAPATGWPSVALAPIRIAAPAASMSSNDPVAPDKPSARRIA